MSSRRGFSIDLSYERTIANGQIGVEKGCHTRDTDRDLECLNGFIPKPQNQLPFVRKMAAALT